ncbi:DUF7263 family protein [Haloplanus salilacus]|uniref:DUF7263 family protein n=1 Tax=Haloplanus salilacus TaxID=2949994 RepID=UPI0030CF5E67
MRGQTNLLSLAVALVLLTGATVLGVTFADAALAEADRDPGERHAARATADRLVAADAPTTVRANALDADAVGGLNATHLDDLSPPVAGADVRVAIDGDPVVVRGAPGGGTTVRRSVVVVSRSEETRRVDGLDNGSTIRVPRRVDRVTVDIDPGPNTTIRTVRANDRVVLHDDGGLDMSATTRLSRYEPTTLRVDAGANATGRVAVTYRPVTVEARTLTVTVDA